MKSDLKTPKVLAAISLILLIIFLISLLIFDFTMEHNTALRTLIINIFNHDPKVQRDAANGVLTITAEQFAANTIVYLKKALIYSISFLLVTCAMNGAGIFCIKRYPRGSAVIFIINGMLLIFTAIIPALLIPAGLILLRRTKKAIV